MVMSRDEVFRASGPAPGGTVHVKIGAKKGTKTSYGPVFDTIGFVECLEAAKNSEHYKSKPKAGMSRGVAAGFWFNVGADSSAAAHVAEDGTVTIISGNPDIGGSRASLALMAAEELGVDYDKVRPVIADTSSIGFNFVTGGSRVTFATGLAVVNSVRDLIRECKVRAAKTWKIDPEAVIWENGMAKPAGNQVGTFEPLTLADLAAQAGRTGGPINGHAQLNVTGAGPGFGVHCVDLKVDDDTGCVTVGRYTAAQDVGTAIHPSYVEGQL